MRSIFPTSITALAGLFLVSCSATNSRDGNFLTSYKGLSQESKFNDAVGADADLWAGGVAKEYRKLLMAGAVEKSEKRVGQDGKTITKTLRKGISKEEAERAREEDGEIPLGKLLRCRVRYFTDGAVIGSRSFVDEAFTKSRERFGPKRKSGARRMNGDAARASGLIWSLRDLRKGVV